MSQLRLNFLNDAAASFRADGLVAPNTYGADPQPQLGWRHNAG
jgi:hypothetical protein